ncbi:hypothetical protein [Neoroseomonas lacus]|uniref:Uncharacterized protein n=1 Tax=Neoroseomonas lacus TaxID=287609 RepID=A0A917KIX7_9PROT|nr:hypothetical protein [Neoroseomonas lacus]GGJ13999.1 hypothetical protein GCM10011320_21550 [Neoroseomonas lacus]
MNAITITAASLHRALTEVEATGRIQGTAAYAGGIAALRALFGPNSAEPEPPIRQMPIEWSALLQPTLPPFVPVQPQGHMSRGPAPTLAQEEAQPAHADSLPSADPPIDIPPLPAGPGNASDFALASPAAEAAAQPLAPAPAPPPVLATEGISPSPEADHAPPGKVREPALLHPMREAAFRAAWSDPTVTNAVIRARLNATPGREIKNDPALYRIAASLNLPKRSDLFTRAPGTAEAPANNPEITSPSESAEAEPEAASLPPMAEATPDPIRRPSGLSADDLAEGDRNIRAGWTVAQMVDWFGITSPEAAAWHAGLRAMDELLKPAAESVVADDEPDDAPDTASEVDEGAAVEASGMAAPATAETIAAPIALSFPEDAQGREIWEAFDSGMSVRDVGADFGIRLSTLTNTHALWQLTRRKELAS